VFSRAGDKLLGQHHSQLSRCNLDAAECVSAGMLSIKLNDDPYIMIHVRKMSLADARYIETVWLWL